MIGKFKDAFQGVSNVDVKFNMPFCSFSSELKELNTRQAKVSVETAKEVTNDKTLKTKQEKERRLREKQQNNTKRFVDERKTANIKQGKEKEKLKLTHDKQMEMLVHDVQKVSFLCINYRL